MKTLAILFATFLPGDFTPGRTIPEMFFDAERATTSQRYITVSGTGSVAVTPDIATIDLAVVTSGKTAQDAVKTNTEQMKKLIASLVRYSINNEDLCTHGFSIKKYEKTKTNEYHIANRIVRIKATTDEPYIASNGLIITIRDINKIGDVLNSITGDYTNINDVDFIVSDKLRTSVLDKARQLAVQDAQNRASLLVKSAGATLGDVRTITEQEVYTPRYSSLSSSVPVSAGKTRVSVGVSITFSIR